IASHTIEFRVEFTGEAPFDQAHRCVDALESLPHSAHATRAHVLAALAAAQVVTAPMMAGHTASEALREAELAGTPTAHGFALRARCVTVLDPESIEARLEDSRKVLDIAAQTGEAELAHSGYFMHLSALVEKGCIAALDTELMPTSQTLSAFPELADGRY